MRKKTFMIILLILATFIAAYYQFNMFVSSDPIKAIYVYSIFFMDIVLGVIAYIVISYVFQKDST